ncbi:hypothetical protein QFW96_12845 [Saccharopolyspora sp. TS4A08]|uniref:Uncharacterized protein n=1 Tax=Saccharopolyspora ipomoeae TaxID=3042027 RepID=A0ABT6PNF3_9PSEU|nr:hypothetical protein [Saccharopolyspora sp. TS4A08]MDI2029510.1 hypothetical protein [Saccharopolyspora sp. TS4A08]
MSTNWQLIGSGKRRHDQWRDLVTITSGCTAAWADNNGFHQEPFPEDPPATSHLWGWRAGTWLRVRLDTPHWWAAVLTLENLVLPEWTTRSIPEPSIQAVVHWKKRDKRTKQYRGTSGLLGGDSIQLVPDVAVPAPFIGTSDTLSRSESSPS